MTHERSWADQINEEVLEPDLPICDPHHHFWPLRDGFHIRDRRYLLDELLADIATGHNIVSTVFAEAHVCYRADASEAMKPVGEVEFANGQAAISASGDFGPVRIAAGIIGHANLNLGDDVRPVLEALIAVGGGRFRGIRHSVGWDASDQVRNAFSKPGEGEMFRDTYRTGFRHLDPLGLTFDAWLYHPQLGDLVDLARAFPETTIILNHLGGPLGIGPYAGRRDEVFNDWKRAISKVALCPNVAIKLGGIQMDLNGFGWEERPMPPDSSELAAATAHYYEHAIEAFGVKRAMFESNFPVDRLSCSYQTIWNTFKRIAKGCSASEKADLFYNTASRIYRL